MKLITIISSVFIFFLLTSCKNQIIGPVDSEIVDFEIHFQNNFDNDDVLLKLDNNNIYAGKLTTDYVWSLAKAFQLQAYSGQHTLFVNLNNSYTYQERFTLTDGLYILIRYYDDDHPEWEVTKGLNIRFTNTAPIYD